MPSFTQTTTNEDEEVLDRQQPGNADLRVGLLSGIQPQNPIPPNANGHAGNDALVPEFNPFEFNNTLAALMDDNWFRELYAIGITEIPEQYDFTSCRENMASALAISCALSASILYVLGGSKDGVEYVIGGVAVNLLQTYFFTKETISFFSKVHDQKQMAAISMVFALFSTSVVAFAAFQMSDNIAAVAAIEALMVFAGNLPQNLYGMFESIKRVLDGHRDEPEAREFLLEKLRRAVDGDAIMQYSIPPRRGVINRTANQVVGFGIGVFLSLSQVGYIRNSVDFISTHSGNNIVGLTLGLLTNLPALCISMFISGKTLAETLLNNGIDLGRRLYRQANGEAVYGMSLREYNYLAVKMALSTFFGFASAFSASTSVHLYNDNPQVPYIPSTALLDDVIKAAVRQGCEIFNGIMAIMAIDKGVDYVNQAYVKAPSDDDIKVKINAMVKATQQKDIATITRIAFHAGYVRVAPMPGRFILFGARDTDAVAAPANDAGAYNALPQGDGEPDHIANLALMHH